MKSFFFLFGGVAVSRYATIYVVVVVVGMKIYGCFATKKKYSRLPSLLKCWRCPGICTSALGICLGMLFHRQLLAGDDVALLHTRHIDCIPYRTYSCVKNLRARSLLSSWLCGLCLISLQCPSGLEISGMAQATVAYRRETCL